MAIIAGIPSTTKFSNIGGQTLVYLGNGASRRATTQELNAFKANPTAFDVYGQGNRLISGPSYRAPAPVATPRPAPAPVAQTASAPVPQPQTYQLTSAPVVTTQPVAPTTTIATTQPATTVTQPQNWYTSPQNPFNTNVPTTTTTTKPVTYAPPVTVDIPKLNLGPFWFQRPGVSFDWNMPAPTAASTGMNAFSMPAFNFMPAQGPR